MQALIIGLSGQVGDALRPLLAQLDAPVLALSRDAHDDDASIRWLRGSLQAMPDLPGSIDTVISLGPLDAFSDWFAQSAAHPLRVVALGSTGRMDKRASEDADERALAARLDAAEIRLFQAARAHGSELTVLRPTMLYGNGRDRSLTPLLQAARRWRLVPLPRGVLGLRQPVHVADVAAAVLACLEAPATAGQAFDLPGGEVLGFDAMLARALAVQVPGARVIRLPEPLFWLALRLAGRLGAGSAAAGAVSRLARDQTADPVPARLAFGWNPRRFVP